MENPLVALLASPGVDSRVQSRGFSSIAQLLAPFSTHTINIRDPSNAQYQSSKVTLDIRDLSRQGHLLTLSVLPHVLHEALVSKSSLDASLESFADCLRRWSEPLESESLRTYIACVFVVASSEEQPLSELSRLIQAQHTQQHASSETKGLSPAHCCAPRWMSPNTLKHYVLLHDAARDDDARTNEVYAQMTQSYGADACQLLRIGVGATDEVTDPWKSETESEQLLAKGLARALAHVTSQGQQQQQQQSDATKRGSVSSVATVSTISPTYNTPSTSILPMTATTISGANGVVDGLVSTKGKRLVSLNDRDACSKCTEKLLKDCMVPHVERLMRNLHEQQAARRGLIGKSLTTGMKKWFGGGSSGNMAAQAAQSYTHESVEMQSRRLADLAFLFGLYSFAHSQYRSVKKDFEADQAWSYFAVAEEMSALALHLSGTGPAARQFPVRYFEESLKHLVTGNGAKYTSVLRCALNASRVYSDLGLHREAAALLSTVATLDSDQCVGVTQAMMARAYEASGSARRKAAFFRVLAGNRFMRAGIRAVALECYRVALPMFYESRWECAEDYLCSILAPDVADRRLAMDCVRRLLRARESMHCEELQADYMAAFLRTAANYADSDPLRLPVPCYDVNEVRVICGERPTSAEVAERHSSSSGSSTSAATTPAEWHELERACYHSLVGATSAFRSTQLVSDAETDNQRVGETPCGERFRLQVPLRNPLAVPLTMRNLRLRVADVAMREGCEGQAPFSDIETLDSLTLAPGESKQVELSVTPTGSVDQFRIECVDLEHCSPLGDSGGATVSAMLPLAIRGRRLNSNPKHYRTPTYAVDERLRVRVSPKEWPLLDFNIVKGGTDGGVFCGQAIRLVLEAENVGREVVTAIAVASNGVDCTDVGTIDEHGTRTRAESAIASNSSEVVEFRLNIAKIAVGDKIRLYVDVRAPQELNRSASTALLFTYAGANGARRQHRLVFNLETEPLLNVTARVLDDSRGLVVFHVSNGMSSESAALSRVEILRVQARRQKLSAGGRCWASAPSKLTVKPLRDAAVQLDCEQSTSICCVVSGSAGSKNDNSPTTPSSDEFWLSASGRDTAASLPSWPAPRPPIPTSGPGAVDVTVTDELQFSILWKASIVLNDGHATSMVGESFVADPFAAAGLSIPGWVVEQSFDVDATRSPNRGGSGGEELSHQPKPRSISIQLAPVPTLSHDFKTQRICEFPLVLVVRNDDRLQRSAAMRVEFVPKVSEAVSSVLRIAPEMRQLWWLDRERSRAQLPGGHTHQFTFMVRVTQPSVYDLGGAYFRLCAKFDGSDVEEVYEVPSLLAIVNGAAAS